METIQIITLIISALGGAFYLDLHFNDSKIFKFLKTLFTKGK